MNPRLPLSPTDFQPSAPFRGSTDPSPEIQAGAAHHPLTLCPILPRLQSNPKPKFQREDSRLHLSVDDLSSTEPEAVTGYRSDGIIAVASVRVRPPKQPVTPRQEVLESGDEVAAAASADEVIAAAADSDQAVSAGTYSIYVLLSLGHKVYYEVLDKVFEAVVAYKRKLDSTEHFSLNLKPQEPTKHQYDWDAAT